MISFCDFVEKVRGKKWKEFFDISVCINYELEDLSRNTCNNHIIVADEILKFDKIRPNESETRVLLYMKWTLGHLPVAWDYPRGNPNSMLAAHGMVEGISPAILFSLKKKWKEF